MPKNRMQRRNPSYHYQTFPTAPPSNRGQPLKDDSGSPGPCGIGSGSSSIFSDRDGTDRSFNTLVPKKQLLVLAFISLAEQTALNSISPYLPEMAATFSEVDKRKVGLFVGVIASSFAAAQFTTNVFWGRLSDRIGRKPVILLGTFLTSVCFLVFGFCRTLPQAIAVQATMGAVNANAGLVSTVLGEITDKSNQSSIFSWLPILYGVGSITGPLVGGLLANPCSNPSGPISRLFIQFPYLLPNLVAALFLLVDFVLSVFWLDESLNEAKNLPPLRSRVKCLFTWLWQFLASYRPSYLRNRDSCDDENGELRYEHRALADACPAIFLEAPEDVPFRDILVPQIIMLMLTYAVFNLNNIAFNSLYPIYSSGERPTGRELSPKAIGLSLGFACAVAIVFQAFLFTTVHNKLGNVWCYRAAFFGFAVALLSMPFIGSDSSTSKITICVEMGIPLLVKTISAAGGLTCAMLLVTNASPKPNTLGVLNGLAQTLGAGGRAIGPLLSGALFTAGTHFRTWGGLLPWGVFGGIAVLGLGLSCALRQHKLENHEESETLIDGNVEA